MGICREERHLAFRVATVRAMCVGLDEFSDGEPIRGFFRGDGDLFSHRRTSSGLKNGTGFKKRLDPVPAIFTANAGVFESSPGRLRIVGHAIDQDTAGPHLGSYPSRARQVSAKDGAVKTVWGMFGDSHRVFYGDIQIDT